MSRRARSAPLLVACVLFGASASRGAQAEERAEILAEASFAEGVKLMHADRCPEAITKFEESERLDPASGTLLDLAYCQARLGRIASAWLTYRQAITLAEAQSKTEHARIARTQAEKLEPELPHLTLVVPNVGTRPSVALDGAPLPSDMWSVPIPVDPGSHDVVVDVKGARTWQTTVTIARKERRSVEVPADGLQITEAPPAPRPHADEPAGRARAGSRNATAEESSTSDSRRTWALVVGGVGAAAITTGAALFTSARLQYDGAGDHCTGNACDDEGFAARDSAASRARVSYVVLATGTALVGASVVLWLTRERRPTSTAMLLSGTPAGLSLSVQRWF
jgi:hypothetical protein